MALKGLKAGSLDRKIDLLKRITFKDGSGQTREYYKLFLSCNASVEELQSKEVFEAEMLTLPFFKVFKIRYAKGISELMKIRYDSEFFDVHSVTEIGRKQGQKILGKRITDVELIAQILRLYEDGRVRTFEDLQNRTLEV
jgi:SPP1 family predicted phage head-tail adaptor